MLKCIRTSRRRHCSASSSGDRKKRLARLVGKRRIGIVLSAHTEEDGALIFQRACKMGLEGIVSKRLRAPYRSGPSRDWDHAGHRMMPR
jgi:ATP-dependent DNA ligase